MINFRTNQKKCLKFAYPPTASCGVQSEQVQMYTKCFAFCCIRRICHFVTDIFKITNWVSQQAAGYNLNIVQMYTKCKAFCCIIPSL